MGEQRLCAVDDIADGGSDRFEATIDGKPQWVMAIRQGDTVYTYLNSCPHIGSPLDFKPGEFLNEDRTHIICTTHAALFRIEDGHCIFGPCEGDGLTPVPGEVRNGIVYVAGRSALPATAS